MDPLGLHENPGVPDLDPAYHNLTEGDMDSLFNTGSLPDSEQTLRSIDALLQDAYCGSIGAEFTHHFYRTETLVTASDGRDARSPTVRRRQEARHFALANRGPKTRRVPSQKVRWPKAIFSEGGESLILLDEIVQRAGGAGVKEVVVGWRTVADSTF